MAGKFELYLFKIGDTLALKKTHPCGNNIWKVERVGQEIGIRCQKCNHFLVIPRRSLEKALREVKKAEDSTAAQPAKKQP